MRVARAAVQLALVMTLVLLGGCSDSKSRPASDAGMQGDADAPDASEPDGAVDDASVDDAGEQDADVDDGGTPDAATPDDAGDLPPDPATVAPPNDPAVPTDIASSVEFLYTGDDAIQQGVAPGTIDPARVVVVHGQVHDRTGDPLPGVTITVLGEPALGRTLSRADGAFDLAVNGGGLLTLSYVRDGFLSAQRQVSAPWRDFVAAPDVVLVPLDPKLTLVELPTADMEVARGSVVTDSAGTRQATVLLRPDTQASMVVHGESVPLTTLSIRATEYTVGAPGPKAMPAVLPPTSGYTYAVELSADEALDAGATSVTFNRPVITYVENYLGFPLGGIVPAGYYDREQAVWVPAPNGKVIEVLAIKSGVADVDTDGDGAADDATTLDALGIDADERAQLGKLYAAGTSLWRVPITHFTPWDYNWPYGPPKDAVAPDAPPPQPQPGIDDPCKQSGSIIRCERQSLGQELPIAGTPYALAYASDRMETVNQLTIPLSGASVPDSLVRIDLSVDVAGQHVKQSFAPGPNKKTVFKWNGKDGFGRRVNGSVPIIVTIGFVYVPEYKTPAEFESSFGAASGGASLVGTRGASEIVLTRTWAGKIGAWHVSDELGGWSFTHQHVYDSQAKVLHLGSGDTSRALGAAMQRFAGAGDRLGNASDGMLGDGGPATKARFMYPYGMAVAPDGSVFISDYGLCAIRRVGRDGIIDRAYGTYECGISPNGYPASESKLYYPTALSFGPDGSLYFIEYHSGSGVIRRVDPDGNMQIVAGNGEEGFTPDGARATASSIWPCHVAAGADGSVYFSEGYYQRVRRVGPDGVLTTVAGNGARAFAGDGGPATSASLNMPCKIATSPDGGLYIADRGNNRVRKVGVDGVITTVAGNGNTGDAGDGDPATSAEVGDPSALAVGRDGTLFVIQKGHRVRAVTPDGIIYTLAGNGSTGPADEGGLAAASPINSPEDAAIGPDGSLYVTAYNERDFLVVQRIGSRFPGFSLTTPVIPSRDGLELYTFDLNGRHLSTQSAVTDAQLFTFDYDGARRLVGIADASGAVTSIERDASGHPTAIVGPDGHRTTLTIDANGWLASLENPAGDVVSFAYTDAGLMTSMTDGRGQTHTFEYDVNGLLKKDSDPAGGSKTLTRVEDADGYRVSTATGLGRTTVYDVSFPSRGETLRQITEPSGLSIVSRTRNDGTTTTTWPDGFRVDVTEGADPRFGLMSPVTTSEVLRAPNGLTSTTTRARTVELDDSGAVATLTRTVTVNGHTWTFAFDAATRTLTLSSPLGRWETATLDEEDHVVQLEAPGVSTVELAYDADGRVTSVVQGDRSRAMSYDDAGRLSTLTDALSATASFAYDALDRVVEQQLPGLPAALFSYDGNSNLNELKPSGKPAHAFGYTPLDLPASYTPPQVTGSGTRSNLYSYDLDGALTTIALPDGTSITADYDAAGRTSAVHTPRSTVTVTYDAAGHITALTDSAGASLAYTYNGPLVTQEKWSGAVAGEVVYGYDSDFRIASTAVNDAESVSRVYDSDGLLVQAGALTLARDAASGRITSADVGGVTTAYATNQYGELATLSATRGDTTLYAETLSRDGRGRITQKTETVAGETHLYEYGYDAAGRLTSVTTDDAETTSYTWDANGNRASVTESGDTVTATYDAQDRLLTRGDTTYTWGPNGDLLSTERAGDADATYTTYDAFGNLVEVTLADGTEITYVIDAQNRRVGRSVDGVRTHGFLWEGDLRVLAELDGNGALVSQFVYGTQANVPEAMIKGGATYRIVTDHLGSVRLVVNTADGAVAQWLDYDAWGHVTTDTNPGFQPFGFAGGLYDPATGLVRFGMRDYDAAAGRWTTRDRVLFDAVGLNLYAYANGDPVTFADPLGLFKLEISAYAGIGAGLSLTIDGRGYVVCGEVGVGAGGGVELGLFDKVGKTDTVIGATASASTKFMGQKVGAKVDYSNWDRGGPCHGLEGEIAVGPVRVKKDLLNLDKDPSINGKLKLADIKEVGKLGGGVSAKLAGRACGGATYGPMGF